MLEQHMLHCCPLTCVMQEARRLEAELSRSIQKHDSTPDRDARAESDRN